MDTRRGKSLDTSSLTLCYSAATPGHTAELLAILCYFGLFHRAPHQKKVMLVGDFGTVADASTCARHFLLSEP